MRGRARNWRVCKIVSVKFTSIAAMSSIPPDRFHPNVGRRPDDGNVRVPLVFSMSTTLPLVMLVLALRTHTPHPKGDALPGSQHTEQTKSCARSTRVTQSHSWNARGCWGDESVCGRSMRFFFLHRLRRLGSCFTSPCFRAKHVALIVPTCGDGGHTMGLTERLTMFRVCALRKHPLLGSE